MEINTTIRLSNPDCEPTDEQLEALMKDVAKSVALRHQTVVEKLGVEAWQEVKYKLFRELIRNIVDMPERMLDKMRNAIYSGDGKMPRGKRAEFEKITDDEIARIENCYWHLYGEQEIEKVSYMLNLENSLKEDKEEMIDPYAMHDISESTVLPMTPTDLRCVLSLQLQHDDVHGLDYYDLNLLPKHVQKRYWRDNMPCNVPSVDTAAHAVWASDYERWRNSVYSGCFKLSGISQDERKRRIDAVAYAKTSLELEGVTFSREALIDQQLYVAGLINENDLAELAKGRIK